MLLRSLGAAGGNIEHRTYAIFFDKLFKFLIIDFFSIHKNGDVKLYHLSYHILKTES